MLRVISQYMQELNQAQVYYDAPGGQVATSVLPPIWFSKGVRRWRVWFAVPPASGEVITARLFRYRRDPVFTYTQVSESVQIDNTWDWSVIHDLTDRLLPIAEDDFRKGDVCAVAYQMPNPCSVRALTAQVNFGMPF